MKERPIIFKPEMVQAILAGRKTQTRRVVKPQPLRIHQPDAEGYCLADYSDNKETLFDHEHLRCPYGSPGDQLWVTQGASLRKGASLENRFWARIYKTATCWEWMGNTNRKKYGLIKAGDRTKAVHRVSWELHHQSPVPKGLHVLHTCDLPWCVNPDHLYLGTNDDNVRDKVARGRQARMFGEDASSSILTAPQVQEIRALYWEQNIYQRDIAAQFGVTQPQVSKIVNRKRWSGITQQPEVSQGSRTLEIESVRVERVQDISAEDCQAEGIQVPRCGCEVCSMTPAICPADASAYVEEFGHLWDSIHAGKPGESWSDNPWTWVIAFRTSIHARFTSSEEAWRFRS